MLARKFDPFFGLFGSTGAEAVAVLLAPSIDWNRTVGENRTLDEDNADGVKIELPNIRTIDTDSGEEKNRRRTIRSTADEEPIPRKKEVNVPLINDGDLDHRPSSNDDDPVLKRLLRTSNITPKIDDYNLYDDTNGEKNRRGVGSDADEWDEDIEDIVDVVHRDVFDEKTVRTNQVPDDDDEVDEMRLRLQPDEVATDSEEKKNNRRSKRHQVLDFREDVSYVFLPDCPEEPPRILYPPRSYPLPGTFRPTSSSPNWPFTEDYRDKIRPRPGTRPDHGRYSMFIDVTLWLSSISYRKCIDFTSPLIR